MNVPVLQVMLEELQRKQVKKVFWAYLAYTYQKKKKTKQNLQSFEIIFKQKMVNGTCLPFFV